MIFVIIGDTQKEYKSMKSAAKAIGISPSTLFYRLKNGGGEFITLYEGMPCKVIRNAQKPQILDDVTKSKIIEMYDTGEYFYSQIASELGLSKYTVRHVISKKKREGC